MAVAVAAGAISGISTSCLIALINTLIRFRGGPLGYLAWAFAGLCLVRLLSGVGSHILLVRLSQAMIRDLRTGLCERVLAAPLRDLERLGAHRLISSFSDDTMQIAQVVINIPYLIVNLVILCGCLVYLGCLSGFVLAALLACMAFGAASYYLPVLYANRQLRAARRAQDGLFGEFRSMLEGLKELKLHAARRQQFMDRQLRPTAETVRCSNVRGVTIYSVAANWSRLLFFVYVGMLLFIWPGVGQLSTAEVAGYIVVILYMMAPIEAVINVLPHLAQADVALEHIHSLYGELQHRPTDSAGCESGRLATSWRELRLQKITHRYEGTDASSFVLGPIDLALHPRELIFVMGGNGSGKTTLAKVLAGLYVPTTGQILLEAQAISDANREQYRQAFSAVFGDFHVFPDILDHSAHTTAAIHRHLLQFGLSGKLKVEDGRLSTTALSQGQRKRLALIMAIMEDRPICVFDEWAADQDPEFRRVFYMDILPDLRAQGKCVVVITHDDRYHSVADRIVQLDYGRITSITGNDSIQQDGTAHGESPAPNRRTGKTAEAQDAIEVAT